MSSSRPLPSDQANRERALNPANSILVQAPAGSGKTDLLTRRFLRLLIEVEDPAQIVAITFTKAAAAEMRHRILSKLEQAAEQPTPSPNDEFSMEALAHRALRHSQVLGWDLLDQPAQLRISTIDSFCRDIALQQPLLSGLGDGLDIYEHPEELYRRAARSTIEQIDSSNDALRDALESLLDWRDNNWKELEDLLAEMLSNRDRWIHDFVVGGQQDWDALRAQLERPFAAAVREALERLSQLLNHVPGARDEALALARFACEEPGTRSPWELAQFAEIPCGPFEDDLETAQDVFAELASFLQTQKGAWRSERGINALDGFPATPRGKAGKARLAKLIHQLSAIPGLESSLAQVRELPPLRYTDGEWQILRACFNLLRHAAAELQVVFSEAGAVDYVEIAQIALRVLRTEDGLPSETAFGLAGRIHHILVDEFQDTSRRQHELLRRLIAAWPDRDGRSCFVVGDPMQSIYFFRDADAELFPHVRTAGLEIPGNEPLLFDPVQLNDNFRTAGSLVRKLNNFLGSVFAQDDGSGVTFSEAVPARDDLPAAGPRFKLHLKFSAQKTQGAGSSPSEGSVLDEPQVNEIVELTRGYMDRVAQARRAGTTYRIAVIGRTRNVLAPIAEALRKSSIPFRAVELEKLSARPEVLDAIVLTRALLNPCDRVAWFGVLRAPWCGLSLSDLHALTSGDDPLLAVRPVSELLVERTSLLSAEGQQAAARLVDALEDIPRLRFSRPSTSTGTWLRNVWQRLGGELCVDATARANLDLLWQSLDKLPNGEQDLPSPALNAALDKLTAKPNPEADSECGVQLMTIHKSKGLEFEVVILPELQAITRKGRSGMLSWLERGLPPGKDADECEDVTEFLVAPFQSKGTQRSNAKAWLDGVYTKRESQEMRRLLYVAATRARDELYLFAQPDCKLDDTGEWQLKPRSGSLLSTAWPGLQEEIEERFAEWKRTAAEKENATVDSIAASSESNLLVMPSIQAPTILRRLPPDFRIAARDFRIGSPAVVGMSNAQLYERHEGGLLTRALGVAVHSLLEHATYLRIDHDWDETRAELSRLQVGATSQIRSAGVDRRQASDIAKQALEIATNATLDVNGQWILSPHIDAASEARWAGVVKGGVRSVHVDRVFRAGESPLGIGYDCWWIVDYKTAQADSAGNADTQAVLPRLRELFAPQLNTYAEVLRKLHGEHVQIRAGLYYPRMTLFDWWEA